MSVIDTLVTDRTYADVQLWQTLKALGWQGMSSAQQAQWSGGLKGAYNATDLNRVQEAMTYLAGILAEYGYSVALDPLPTWTIGQIPSEADMSTYLSNLSALRATISVLPSTPEAPGSMAQLTYAEANAIEQILSDINLLLTNMTTAWFYSGDIYSGEVT